MVQLLITAWYKNDEFYVCIYVCIFTSAFFVKLSDLQMAEYTLPWVK